MPCFPSSPCPVSPALHPPFPPLSIPCFPDSPSPFPQLSMPLSQALRPLPDALLPAGSVAAPRVLERGSGKARRGFLRVQRVCPRGRGVPPAGLGVPPAGLGSPPAAGRASRRCRRNGSDAPGALGQPGQHRRGWIFGAHSPVVGFPPSSSVEFVPVLPPVYTAAVPPHAGKGWIDKRLPSCKIYLNNAFALDSAWLQPEESRLFQGAEKPLLLSNQVAMAVARPAAASRPLPMLVLAPQLIPGGCQNSLKAVGGTQSLALVSLEPEAPQGPPGPSLQPCHLLTLSPIKVPLLASPFPGKAPAVGQLWAHGGCRWVLGTGGSADSASSGNKPVASTPVPGSPWCVVWTGDDRVFFFNPTMQLSVWERPLDLRHRGDIKRLLEDPPHKRKLEAAATDKCVSSCPGDENDDLSVKTKRNKTEECQAVGSPEEEQGGEEGSASRISPPLEERITHFRDMLLERGVSAFSTWEKELHKIVFDPRYLLLNPEERKQVTRRCDRRGSGKTTFKEFAEKYGRDQRFRLVQKKKDQEHFFNQFILILKKRDKENRIRLRKMR
uniref:Transcription elongation regulator 1 like n=1 Tax=Cyanoderma ruficeps TaxID=181631 RepID=A0A8C3XGJ1_9PASS